MGIDKSGEKAAKVTVGMSSVPEKEGTAVLFWRNEILNFNVDTLLG